MSYNTGARIVTNGLVMYLDAANSKSYVSGSNSWVDLTRNGNNGTLTNGPTFSSANGGGILFDGTNDYIQLGNSTKFSGNNLQTLTLFQWFYYTGIGSTHSTTLAIKREQNSSLIRTMINENPISTFAQGYIGFLTRSNDNTVTSGLNINYGSFLNKWINIACVVSGMNRLLYVNGSLMASDSNIGMQSLVTLNGTSNIGSFVDDSIPIAGTVFTGNIPTTLIYNRALSVVEITQNYNATKKRFGL